MSNERIGQRAARHVAAFNHSVRSGDWTAFADRFTPDATMRFTGIPVGPFTGREAIAAGYASQPPSDTLTLTRGVSSGDIDELWFTWDNGDTGRMTLRRNRRLRETKSLTRLRSGVSWSEESRGVTMKVEYLHASTYGNGVTVAEEFSKQMAAKGVTVNVHHIRDAKPKDLPPADLYLFSSPARFGKPIRGMRRFLKKVELPQGTRYAILTTEAAAHPDPAGRVPSDEQMARWTRVRPIMNDILRRKGLVEVAEGTIHVTGVKGPLEEGWQHKVGTLVAGIPVQS